MGEKGLRIKGLVCAGEDVHKELILVHLGVTKVSLVRLMNKCLVRIFHGNAERYPSIKPTHFLDCSCRSLSGGDKGQFPQGNHCEGATGRSGALRRSWEDEVKKWQ